VNATFLFADVAGFTALTEAHGDEEVADLVGRCCAAVRADLPLGRITSRPSATRSCCGSPTPPPRSSSALSQDDCRWSRGLDQGRAMSAAAIPTSYPAQNAGYHEGMREAGPESWCTSKTA
jgi:hypothetical protein